MRVPESARPRERRSSLSLSVMLASDSDRAQTILEVSALRKHYGSVRAVRGVSFEVRRGEIMVLLGPSGCGKSTILRLVAGLEHPDGGTVRLNGKTIVDAERGVFVPSEKRNMGMVFQSYALWPHMTVFENIVYPLKLRGIKGREAEKKVAEVLGLVGLAGLEDRQAPALSGGQQQRVALARALVFSPKVLLLDEPLSNLDARLREDVRGKIRGLAKQLGATVLYVTHDQIEAMAMADKIALMSSGKLLQYGEPMELYRRPNCAEVADFFGAVNWLSGTLIASTVVETRIGRFEVCPHANAGPEVLIGFRPESLQIVHHANARGKNSFDAVLQFSTFLGDQFIYEAIAKDQLLVGKSRVVPMRNDARTLHLYVDPSEIMVFSGSESKSRVLHP